jgi:preprotein translocase subunit YajC
MTLLELLPFAAVALVAWLLLFRPAKARRDAQAALVAALVPGVRIMTTAGVFGTVRAVDADRMELEIAPGVVIEMVPQAVGRILDQPGAPDAGATDQAGPAESDDGSGEPGERVPNGEADRG